MQKGISKQPDASIGDFEEEREIAHANTLADLFRDYHGSFAPLEWDTGADVGAEITED